MKCPPNTPTHTDTDNTGPTSLTTSFLLLRSLTLVNKLLLLFVFGTILLFTGAPFHPSTALGPHTLYSVPSFQTSQHPPGSVPTGSHPIGQIASISRDHMSMYRGMFVYYYYYYCCCCCCCCCCCYCCLLFSLDSSLQQQVPCISDMPGYSPQIYPPVSYYKPIS